MNFVYCFEILQSFPYSSSLYCCVTCYGQPPWSAITDSKYLTFSITLKSSIWLKFGTVAIYYHNLRIISVQRQTIFFAGTVQISHGSCEFFF